MKLSVMFKKATLSLKEALGLDSKDTVEESKTVKQRQLLGQGESTIVMKVNKNQALIKCWNCGKELWVKKGSPCFREGTCNPCLGDAI